MLYLIVNIVYLIIVFLIYKMRKSKSEDIRMFSNDYELYESLPDEIKQSYWDSDTKLVIFLMIGIGIIMNISILISNYVNPFGIIVFIVLSFIALLVWYTIKYRTLVKKVRGKK